MSMYAQSMSAAVVLTKSPVEITVLALQFKAMGDPTRLELIVNVVRSANAEACVCDLTPNTGLTQRGKWAYYCLTSAATEILKSLNISTPAPLTKKQIC